jgi:hypothetical protein
MVASGVGDMTALIEGDLLALLLVICILGVRKGCLLVG